MTYAKHALLTSVAAVALIAGASFASAQAPAAQRGAPAEKMAPAQEPKQEPKDASKNKAPDAGLKAGQASEKAEPKRGTAQRAPDRTKDDMKSKATSSETKPLGKTSSEIKPDVKSGATVKPDTKADVKNPARAGDSKAGAATQGAAGSSTTGAAGGSTSLSAEQRTTIHAVIKKQNVQPLTNVAFAISVGTVVPRTVRYYPVPVELVRIYPHWRGYDYFLVGDQIIVVDPRTHKIVAVLEA